MLGIIEIHLSASEASVPQDACGAETPSPIKLKNDSVNIASGTDNVRVTIIGPIQLGIRCLNNILIGEEPKVFARYKFLLF